MTCKPKNERRYIRSPRRSALLACGLLLIIIAAPCVLTGRAWRQETLDRTLIAAIQRNDAPAALKALERGADANAREQSDPTSFWLYLMAAVRRNQKLPRSGSAALLIVLEPLPTSDMFYRFRPESTALVSALLRHGAQVEPGSPGFSNQDTALHWAACSGKATTLTLLAQQGARLNARNTYGKTPLQEAVWNGKEASVRTLVVLGADVNSRDNRGKTALHEANLYGRKTIARLLKAAGAKE